MINGIVNTISTPGFQNLIQNTTAQVSIETGLKAVGRPLFTLADKHADEETRKFWVEHGIRCRKIGEYFYKTTGKPCVINHWTPDGDKEFPTICGTGTEDYFCGAYNFDVNHAYVEYTTPYAGMYKVRSTDGIYKSQRYFNLYRWHITDPVYFKEDLKVTVQALGWRRDGRYLPLKDDISSVAYWYSDTIDCDYPPYPSLDEIEL